MKTFTTATAVLAASSTLAQVQPLAVSYGGSLSGKEYVLASTTVDRFGNDWGVELVAGWEARDTLATVWWPGVSWSRDLGKAFHVKLGASVLFGAQKPDLVWSAGFGVKF